jgi:excisionase family DNA binding protein
MEQEYFTPREVAERLRVDYTTVMRWIRAGLLEVETIREGKRNRHRIKKAAIDALRYSNLQSLKRLKNFSS